jgi:ABC-type oligopeptide transport system substrate-binding subunit
MSFTDGQSAGHGNVNELIVAATTRPAQYNWMISNSWYDSIVINTLYDGLVERDNDLNFVPGMATALPVPVAEVNNYDGLVSSTDPNTATVWELEIRNDIYWHEGYGYTMAADSAILNLDADDVVWFVRARLDSNGPSDPGRPFQQLAFGTDPMKGIEKIGQYKVRYHLNTIYADLLTLFGTVMPQHILDTTYDAGYGPVSAKTELRPQPMLTGPPTISTKVEEPRVIRPTPLPSGMGRTSSILVKTKFNRSSLVPATRTTTKTMMLATGLH